MIAFSPFAAGQRGAIPDCELRVKVTLENDQPLSMPVQVVLVTLGGSTAADAFTDSTGQATFRAIRSGNYRLRVSGNGIADSTSDSFNVDPRDRIQVQYVRVKVMEKAQRQAQGAASVSTAELKIPDKARKEFDKGTAAMSKSDWDAAARHLRKATELYPNYASALNDLGVVSINRHDEQAARGYFQQAVSVDDHLTSAYLNLSKLDYNQHRLQEAQEPLTKALAIDPANLEAMLLKAASQLALGGFREAALYARKIHTFPHESLAISHIIAARALEQSKQSDQAIDEYQLFLHEAPQSSMAKAAREAVSRLQNAPRNR